jgi:hypothetical protein
LEAGAKEINAPGFFRKSAGRLAALSLSALFFGYHFSIQIAKWKSFHYATFDYSNVAGFFEELLNGRHRFLDPTHIYGLLLSQFHFINLAIYAARPSPYTLMAISSASLALAIYLAFAASDALLKHSRWAIWFALAFALNPFFDVASLSGFRPAAPAVPAALGMFISWQKEKRSWFILSSIIFCSSQANLIVGALLLGLALWRWGAGRRQFGKTLTIIATAWLVLSMMIPFAVTTVFHLPPPAKITHLAAFGSSFSEIIRTVITRPGFVFQNIFYYQNITLVMMVLSFFLLPTFAPLWLIGAAPEFFYLVISTYGLCVIDPRTSWALNLSHPLFSFVSTGFLSVLPFLFITMIQGAARARDRWGERFSRFSKGTIEAAFVVMIFAMHYFLTPVDFGPVPLARGADSQSLRVTERDIKRTQILGTLDSEKSYLMDFPFFFWAYNIPNRRLIVSDQSLKDRFDYVLLDLQSSCRLIPKTDCDLLHDQLLAAPEYEIVFDNDGLIMMRRKADD